jgi:hypothetical protein
MDEQKALGGGNQVYFNCSADAFCQRYGFLILILRLRARPVHTVSVASVFA